MANVYPNSTTGAFCKWLLANSLIRLTSPRKVQVLNVQTAATNGTTVTQLYFEEFCNYTNRFYWEWQQYIAGQPASPTSSGLDAMTTAWLAVATAPAQQTIYAVDVFFKQLRADANLQLDYFFLFAQDQQVNAKIDLINPTLYAITEHASPTWAANLGYTGNGSTMYLSVNFKDATNAVNYTTNNGMFGFYGRKVLTAAAIFDMGSYDGTNESNMRVNYTGGLTYFNVNTNNSQNVASSNTQGLMIAQRTASNLTTMWKNGLSAGTGATASNGMSTVIDNIMCSNQNGTPTSYNTNQYTIACKGSGAINMVTFNSAVNLLMTNLGAHY